METTTSIPSLVSGVPSVTGRLATALRFCLLAFVCVAVGCAAGPDETQTARSALTASSGVINIQAVIDGRSRLVLKGDSARWEHLDFAAPGRLFGANFPTIINGTAWFPNWPDVPDSDNRFCNCSSDTFIPVTPGIPRSPGPISLQVVQARGRVDIVQSPSESNDFALVIEFDDNAFGADDFYEINIEIQSSCPVGPLSPITDALAQEFEAANGEVVETAQVSVALFNAVAAFRAAVTAQGGTSAITSGFRPTAYQSHLYELRTRFQDLDKLDGVSAVIIDRRPQLQVDPNVPAAVACQSLLDEINREIRTHLLRPGSTTGAPVVAAPGTSAHETGNAVDISVAGMTEGRIDQIAATAGLHRPLNPTDDVHYQLLGQGGRVSATVTGNSPINLLVTDPLGRRLGFDPVTNAVVNDFGGFAEYTGPGSEPQVLMLPLGSIVSGLYRVTGIGTGAGPYSVSVETVAEHEQELLPATIVSAGIAVAGQPIVPVERLDILLRSQLAVGQFNQAFGGLRAMVEGFIESRQIRNEGIGNSLLQKVRNAERKIQKGEPDAARTLLGSFEREVRAQRGKHISIAAADALLGYVRLLEDALQGKAATPKGCRTPH